MATSGRSTKQGLKVENYFFFKKWTVLEVNSDRHHQGVKLNFVIGFYGVCIGRSFHSVSFIL